MKNYPMRTIPAVAAMAAALIFGVQAQAQTSTGDSTKMPAAAAGGDSGYPSGAGISAKDADARTAAMAEKKAAKAAKKSERQSRSKTKTMSPNTGDSSGSSGTSQ